MLRARTLIPLAALIAALAMILSTFQLGWFGNGSDDTPAATEALVIGRSFRVDEVFEDKVGQAIPARFQLILPKSGSETHSIGVSNLPEGGIVQFNFRDENTQFLESLFVAPLNIPMGPMEERLETLKPHLEAQAPALLRKSYEQVAHSEAKRITVGNLQAVELTGSYLNPSDGASYSYRFIALPHPNKRDSLYVVSHVHQAFADIATPEDHAKTLTGLAMSTFRYTDLTDGS